MFIYCALMPCLIGNTFIFSIIIVTYEVLVGHITKKVNVSGVYVCLDL